MARKNSRGACGRAMCGDRLDEEKRASSGCCASSFSVCVTI